MKKTFFAFLAIPFFCFALGNFETFKKFDGPSRGESYFYAGLQSSMDRVMGNFGVRYQDEMIGFDATMAAAPGISKQPPILFAQTSLLIYPWEETLYAGIGPGVSLAFAEAIKLTSFFGFTLGLEYESNTSRTYFAEGTFIVPGDFRFENAAKAPGFRLGVGF